jgi:hypothetical protein
VSLILEALKKLERDRETSARGFLVLAQPSPPGERVWTRRAAWLAAAALGGGAVAALLLWPGRAGDRPAAPPPTTVAAAPAEAPPTTLSSAPDPGPSTPPARPLIVWRPVRGTPRPAVQPTSAPPPAVAEEVLQLQAISERDGAPVAVVSGQMVRVGDRVGSGTVVRIGAAEIEIETDGKRQILKF